LNWGIRVILYLYFTKKQQTKYTLWAGCWWVFCNFEQHTRCFLFIV